MKIHTYHESIGRDCANMPLVYLWKERWQKLGWEPVILSEADARRHPKYSEYNTAYHKLPTVNGKAYETACYLRWLAMSVVGGGWMADYDVIGYDFKPEKPTERLTLWNGGACPCMVSGSAAEYDRMASVFAKWVPTQQDMNFAPGPHCSDQNILDQLTGQFDVQRKVVQYLDAGWEQAPAVHYAGCVMNGKQPKFNHIPKLR